MLFLLLIVGTNAAWAWNVRGEGLPGLNTCSGCGNWNSNIVEMTGIGDNTYCATFLNVAAESGTRYRFKICDNWKGTDNLDQSKSNVNFVDAGDKRISFTLPYESNVYVFYNSSTDKIWVIAIPVSVSNYNGSSDIRQDLGLDKDGWLNKDKGGVRFTSSSAYAKRVAAFVIPKGMQWRYEIYTGDTKKVSKTTVPKSDDNTRLALVVWDGSSNTANVTMMPYVQKKSGWKLFVDDVEQGTVNSNGDYTVNNLSATSHTFYFTNGESTTYNGVNYFGGCYVNTSVSSSLFSNHQYYKTDAVGTFLVPTIDDKGNGSNSNYYMLPKGKFTLSGGAKDVTFNFDGGVITINAVDHVEAFSGDFYVYGAGSNAQNWVTGWSSTDQGGGKANPANHMTITNNVARKTYYGVKGDNLEFKVSDGTNDVGTWSNYSTSKQSGVSASANNQNIRFSLSNASDVTVCYDGTNVWLEVKERQKPNDAWRVTGTFNSWSIEDEQMKGDETQHCKTITIGYVTAKAEHNKNNHSWVKFKLFKGTSWEQGQVNHDNATIIGLDGTVIGTNDDDNESLDGRILVQVDEPSDITFSYYTYSNGTNVITVKRVATTLTPITYTGKEYVFLSKTQKHTNDIVFDWSDASAHIFVYFWNAINGASNWSDEAFFWDNGNNVLAAKVPAGSWTNCKIVRKNSNDSGKNWNNVWNKSHILFIESGKNYLQTGESSVWDVYTPPFYLTGTETLCGGNWGNTWPYGGLNNTVYSGSVIRENIPAGTYQFKLNPTKDYSSNWGHSVTDAFIPANSAGSNVTLSAGGGGNIQFELSNPSDVTIAYDGNGVTVNAVATAVVQHTVTFMDGETELTELAQNIAEGAYASEPDPAPTKSGYSSVKWQLSGADYNFNTPVTTDITLDAVWTAKMLESISLDESSIVMVKGGSNATLTPSFLPADLIAEKRPTYDWSVSEGGVVTVDGGVITAVGEGTVTVTCTAHGTDKSANCVVTVKDCNTEPTDIFTYTLGSDPTGIAAGSAVMNGMFNEASNTVEPTLQQVNIQLSAETNDHKWIYDNGDETRNVKIDNETDDNKVNDAFKWYVIEVSEGVMALQNVNTKHYLAMSDEVEDNGNVWGRKFATTIESYITNVGLNNDALWKWGSCDENSPRLKVMSTAQNNANYTTGEYTLHCYGMSNNWRPDNTVMVGSQDGCQGNKHLRPFFKNAATVPNPAYMHSPVSGYYRFATGASVVVTLNRAIKVNDVIRLEVKNPSKAAVSATVTIGSQVENINLAAETTTTEEITVTDANRPTSITIASNDVNFMLKSVVVNREMPNPGRNPNLAWGATPSAAHQVAAGDISDYIATRSGAGLITYTSSDESIATVADNGTVHPIAEGTVTITATLEQDGCYNGGSTSYSLTLEDLPKPTITITANDEMPQGSYQTVTVTQNGDGALTFGITSGTGATLTNNGEGTYLLALAGNATDIVLTASTERTEQKAQHSVSKNISVQQCYVDGHDIYEYELTGHDDVADVAATGGTYSQANLASVGTDDNPKTVTKIKLKFSKGNGNRIYAVDNGGNLRVQDVGNVDIAEWLLIPAGETVSNPFGTNASYPVYYVCNAKTGRYIYYGSTTSGSGDWVYTIAQLSSTNYKTNYYKWFIEVNNGETRIFSVQNRTNERKSSFKLNSANQYDSGYGSDVKNDHSLLCVGKMSDTNEYSRIYTDNGEMNVGSAANPDYFYSVTHEAHEYYILNGGTVTVSRASAFKADDVITLNVFNRGEAASSTIKVAENTITTNVNGAVELTYTVTAGDGIQGETSFVITPLYEFICLNSISIFRPKDEDEFINPVLSWDADLSAQQRIDMNNSETGMTHTVSVNAPVNEAVVYSVSPAAKADINSATGALTLTNEAQNKDVLTVTATLPAIGCYNQAVASYEIYVKNLAAPSLSAAFGTLKQGYASTLTVTTNSDAVPALSSLNGFAVNGDPTVDNGVYTYNIIVSSTAEAVSVHVALEVTADYLAYAIDAADANVAVSNIADLYDNTPANGTLVLEADYAGELVINKTLTINGNGHSIGNLKVENVGDLTLSGALTVNDFTICAKAGNSEHQAASGQVREASNLTVNGNAYFLYTVDPSGHVQYGWYNFTVPFPVNVMSGIKGIQSGILNEDFVNERDYAIMEFLGDKKAAGQYAYKKFRGIMQPGILYSITLDDEYNYNTIRFKKTDGALAPIASVDLPGHSGEIETKEDWNGVGNGSLHHINIGGVSPDVVIQVYQSGDKSFLPVDPSSCSFAVGVAFMIQGTGTMTFPQASHVLLAPRRAASAPQRTAIQIAGEGKPFSDQLFISADEMAGQAYTQGVDVAKAGDLGSAKVAQLWTNAYNTPLCAHEAQLINGEAHYALSIYAPANGSYTLTSQNIPDGATLYLTQNGNRIWDMSEAYTLDLTKGTNTEYGLLLVESHKIPTGVDAINSNADTKKIMRNGILYILRNGKVYTAQGAMMQ